jgi:hypothetical protein
LAQTIRLLALLSLAVMAQPSCAREHEAADTWTPSWYLQGGAYIHYTNKDKYEGAPVFASIEYHQKPKLLWGFSMFENSFGDFTQYAYVGREFHPWENKPNLHIKLSAGVVQGYKDEHQDILPIRWGNSWGLGAVPSVGFMAENFGFDVAVLSTSGLLFLAGYQFD